MHEKDNYLKTAELSTEQNCNMIDGVPNNTPIPPTPPELDAKPGYILHIDLAPVKELISLQRRCSNNLNQVAIHAHTYGVYPEEIDGLKRDYEKLWSEVSKVLRELSELVAK